MKKFIIVILASIAFFVPTAQAEWWTANEVKKEHTADGLQNYEEAFGESLRAESRLFPTVPTSGPINWYHILGIDADADADTKKCAIRRLLLATHPDKGGDDELSKAVNLARAEAKDDEYDDEYVVEWNGEFESQFGNFDQRGPGLVYHVEDLPELFCAMGEREKLEVLGDNFETTFAQETKEWKRFYIAKFALYGLSVLGYKKFKKHERVKRLQARWNQFKKKHSNIATALDFSGRAGWVALAALYPLYKFRRFFTLSFLDGDYRSENFQFEHIKNNDDLDVFYKMVTVGRRTDSEGNPHPIKGPSRPVGYMGCEEVRQNFMPLRKSKAMAAISVVESAASAWMGCIV